MTATTDILTFADATGATVMSQADYAALSARLSGFQVGLADPLQLNKVWRQSSFIAAAVANFIINQTGVSVPDDGNLAALITNLTNAISGSSSLTSNGYQKFPGGLIIQWGSLTAAASTTGTFNFPIAFQSAALAVVGSVSIPILVGSWTIGFAPLSTTQFQVQNTDTNAHGCYYVAIGK